MKFKRFMFKVLRFKVLIPIAIVIIATVLLCAYFFGGVKANALDDDNLDFDFSNFVSYEDKEYDEDEVLAGKYRQWLTQNDKYVMYFDEATTIAYIYRINEGALTNEVQKDRDGNNTEYKVADLSKCTLIYTTASTDTLTDDSGANFKLSYADGSTGAKGSEDLNTLTNSVFYKNTLTDETEHHYFLNFLEDGVQILYGIGKFSAGLDYFPQKIYQTIYKPFNGTFEGEVMEGSYADPEYAEQYQTAMENWIEYMQLLGCEDPENATEDEINSYLEQTYEQRFRGNALFKMNKPDKNIAWKYTGTLTVYTEACYEYVKQLIADGKITAEGEWTFKYDSSNSASKYFVLGNACWEIKGVCQEFFDGEGVYYNCEDSPIIVNTAIPTKFFESDLGCGNNGNAYTVTSDQDHKFRYYERKSMNSFVKTSIFNMLYKTDNVWEDSLNHFNYVNADGEEYICGGILKFEDGHYVYGEDGKIEKVAYTLDKALEDNEIFDIEITTDLPVFAIAVQFKLTDNGLDTTVLSESLVDSRNASTSDIEFNVGGIMTGIGSLNKKYEMLSLTILPEMTTTVSTKQDTEDNKVGDEGYILIPDGSGAIINFGNGKYELGYEGVNKVYYGSDYTFATQAQPEDTKDLMLGMFGYVCTTEGRERGVIGVIEKGGNQNSLEAKTDQFKNYAYFTLVLTRYQEVKIGTGSGAKPFYKLAENVCSSDAQYLYIFLDEDELEYSDLAKKYQSYLIERDYGVGTKLENIEKDTTRETVVDLNFLGSFEKYALFLGFKYKTADSLTTFDQAQDIITELTETGVTVGNETKKISEYSVSYTSWTNEEMEYEVGNSIKVNSVLGGKSGMSDFVDYLAKDNKTLYLETKITTTKGYDYTFGKLKYSARNVANEVASVYDYNPSTLRQDKKLSTTHYINPMYYAAITNEFIKGVTKVEKDFNNSVGYYVNDLGNLTVNSYKHGDEVYGGDTVAYQVAALKQLKDSGAYIKSNAPYDYAFKYVDEAVNIPLTSTKAPIYDETIPFYQLVVSGLFDYTTEEINGTSNKSANWFYAKAIETGSNLSFVISAENPNILLDTDYTYYYQSYYQNWKETIVDFTNKINELGIHNGRLVYHSFIDLDIAYVQYELYSGGTIDLLVNSTQNDYTLTSTLNVNGITIPAGTVVSGYSYKKVN